MAQALQARCAPLRKDRTKLQINRQLRRRPLLDQIRPHGLAHDSERRPNQRLSEASDINVAPTHEKFRSRGEGGVCGKVQRRCGHLLWPADATERNALLRAFEPAVELLLG